MITPKQMDEFYRDEHGNIPEFFYIIKRDLGILENPKADALMKIAWDLGHSNGYYEVYIYAQDLVELII